MAPNFSFLNLKVIMSDSYYFFFNVDSDYLFSGIYGIWDFFLSWQIFIALKHH